MEYKYSVYYNKKLKKWVGAIELGKDPFGVRKRKVIYRDTEKEANRKVSSIVLEMEDGIYIEDSKDTFIGFLREYYKSCEPNWEDTTQSLYKMYIDVHFEPYFGSMKLTDVKPMVLDKFYNSKRLGEDGRQKLAVNTVRKFNGFFRSAFTYAMNNKMVKENPTNFVILPQKTKYKPTVYNEKQFLELLKFVEGTDDEIPIILGGGCGFRRGEIFGLRWKNIDFKNKTITIEETSIRFDRNIDKDGTKNESSQRTIIVPNYVIDVLEKYRDKKGGINPGDKIITRWLPGSYSERYGKLLKRFGLPHTRLHDLRHYNAVIMMNKGIPDKAAADWLGHSDVRMLHEVYQHVQEDMKKKTSKKLNEMFKEKKKSAVKPKPSKEK